jgi:hypothetical protein
MYLLYIFPPDLHTHTRTRTRARARARAHTHAVTHFYDLVLISLTHPRGILSAVLQIEKTKDLSAPLRISASSPGIDVDCYVVITKFVDSIFIKILVQ